MNYKSTSIKTMMLGAIALSIFAASCKKDTQEISKADVEAVDNLLSKMDPEMQSFTIDASQPQTITGTEGTVINIPANAFVDANGNAVTGNVTISLKEILSLKDQITSGAYAVSNGELLKSGGEFFFEATANGAKLKLAMNQYITFDIPASEVDSTMQVFIGQEVSDDSTGSNVNWVPADTSEYKTAVLDTVWNPKDTIWTTDTAYQATYQLFMGLNSYTMRVYDIYNTSYYNCDHFYGSPKLISELPVTITSTNKELDEVIDYRIQLVYKQLGSVEGAYSSEFGYNMQIFDNTFSGNIYSSWLTDEDVTVIVVGVGSKSKKAYFGKTSLNIKSNSNPSISISTISDAELATALDNL
ncbi:MAG: hypothetical protein NT150_15590 [Bacteroidetes bacterium]|nr:hypothetical protein [Bacteroidota bacterium]